LVEGNIIAKYVTWQGSAVVIRIYTASRYINRGQNSKSV